MHILKRDEPTVYTKKLTSKERADVAKKLSEEILILEISENTKADMVREANNEIKKIDDRIKKMANTYREGSHSIEEKLDIYYDQDKKERVFFKPGDQKKELFRRLAQPGDDQRPLEMPDKKNQKKEKKNGFRKEK